MPTYIMNTICRRVISHQQMCHWVKAKDWRVQTTYIFLHTIMEFQKLWLLYLAGDFPFPPLPSLTDFSVGMHMQLLGECTCSYSRTFAPWLEKKIKKIVKLQNLDDNNGCQYSLTSLIYDTRLYDTLDTTTHVLRDQTF